MSKYIHHPYSMLKQNHKVKRNDIIDDTEKEQE